MNSGAVATNQPVFIVYASNPLEITGVGAQGITGAQGATGGGTSDTGSLLISSSLAANVMTFEKGNHTTYDLDLSGVFVDQAVRTAIRVKNVWTGAIAKGTPCFITGSGASGNLVGVVPSQASDPTVMPAGVILGETLTNTGDEGIGYINGYIAGVDTSAFKPGDSVYVGINGGYTNVRPTGNNLVQKIGNVEKVHNTNGSGVILGAGRANDVPISTPVISGLAIQTG